MDDTVVDLGDVNDQDINNDNCESDTGENAAAGATDAADWWVFKKVLYSLKLYVYITLLVIIKLFITKWRKVKESMIRVLFWIINFNNKYI